MYKARVIAEWFVQRAARDVNKGGDFLTQLKLQKLLYYAQGFYMAFNDGKKLFKDSIIHMQYGPVVKSLIPILKNYSNNPISTLNFEIPDLDEYTLGILNLVYDKLGQYSAYKLVELTHAEGPWKNTTQGQEILAVDIYNFIKEHYTKQ